MTEGRRQEIEQNLSRVHSDWRAFSVRAPQDIADLLAEVKALREKAREVVHRWRVPESADAIARGYVEAGMAMQTCANDLEASLGLRAGEEER